MHTTRILKVLALAMEANPSLPLPLTIDNIDLDDIISTPYAERNTAATMYARDTGQVVKYIGNSGVVYDRIDIARYWRPETIVEEPYALTVGDLATVLKSRYGLDVLSSEIKNSDALLPDSGTVHIEIDDAVSPLYIGEVDIVFAKDAGLAGQDGIEYVLGSYAANSRPVLGWTDNDKDTVQVSINHGVWQTVKQTKIEPGLFSITSPAVLTGTSTNIRIRGTKPMLIDFDGNHVKLKELVRYKSFTEATGFFAGITTLTTVDADAFKDRPDLTSADYLFDGCTGLTSIPVHLFSYCPNLVTAKATFRKTSITDIPESLLESCSRLEDISMMFEQCTKLKTIPAKLLLTNTGLKTTSRCFLGTTAVTDEIPDGFMSTLVNLEDASFMFAGCPWVTTIPDHLLTACTSLKDLSGFFSTCVNLMVIPSDLLYGLVQLNRVDRMFESCSKIASIPPGLFQYNVNLEYMQYTFASTGILTTPAVMFTYTRRLLSIDYVFSNCVRLTAIPDTLLQPLMRLQSLNGVWMNCIGITAIPTNLLSQNKNILSADWLFAGSGITAIPAGVFTACTKITSLEGTFAGTRITSIMQAFFTTLVNLVKVDKLFYKCAMLGSIPGDLFLSNSKLQSMVGTFAYCIASGSNIGTLFMTMSVAQRTNITNILGLYQGSVNLQGNFNTNLKALLPGVDWTDASVTQGCVAGLTKLSDYATVGTIYKTPVSSLV